MGRELRMVPPDWEHPVHGEGYHTPLYQPDKPLSELQQDWDDAQAEWDDDECSYTEYHGARPTADRYMPYWEESEATHFQLYETTSEGTPKGPVFASLDELCAWAEDNATTFANFKASAVEWRRMLDDGLVITRRGNMIFL